MRPVYAVYEDVLKATMKQSGVKLTTLAALASDRSSQAFDYYLVRIDSVSEFKRIYVSNKSHTSRGVQCHHCSASRFVLPVWRYTKYVVDLDVFDARNIRCQFMAASVCCVMCLADRPVLLSQRRVTG